jgi:hypothetical protein
MRAPVSRSRPPSCSVPAAGADPLVERVQRPGLAHGAERGLDQRPTSRRINIAWISFFARVRARISRSRRDRRRRNIRVSSSGVHTASSSPAHNNLANVLASSGSVFARACVIPVSPGLTTITFATRGSMIRTISHALPVTSNNTRSRCERKRRHARRDAKAGQNRSHETGLACRQ